MESGSGGASNKGFLIPVSDSLDVFHSILAPLQNAYLYEESKQFFRYESAVLVKNPELEEKYNAFRAKKKNAGYSENDLKESYGFLLFDDSNKANALGETGVVTGNSTCTTLGDPSKGVYISMYSDCLDLNRWYHGKSGYIVIIRLTKGKVHKVVENYTQNYTEPTVGFDCHVSEQLSSVSAKTSSFLAFDRTQYYIYELLDDGTSGTAWCPSAACPVAVVSFSYTDTKETLPVTEKRSEVKKLVCQYLPWKGQLQIDGQNYIVELKPAVGAFVPTKLPPVVNVDKIISMSDVRRLLPRAVFETSHSDEVCHHGFYCSLREFVPSELEEASSFAQLLWKIKERDLALVIPLNDSGFLILLHPSHFLTYDDATSTAAEALRGIFVFPDSRVVRGDTKFGKKKSDMPFEILQVLPVLSYVEAEIEKMPVDSSEGLCDVVAQHMQRYATLINPGLAISPSREVSIFPDQYDIADAHKHLYSLPEWTNKGWQSLKSYLSKPASFQLLLSKVSEILIAGQEERREDLDDDVYICLSSPEEVPTCPFSMELENQLCHQQSPVNVETSVDIDISSVEPQGDLLDTSHNVVQDILQVTGFTKDNDKCIDPTELNKSDNAGAETCLTPSTSEDLPTELIVSITSAEQTVTEKVCVASTVSTPKDNDLKFSGFGIRTKLQTADLKSLSDETDTMKKVLDSSMSTNVTGTKKRKRRRGRSKAQKKAPKPRAEPHSLQSVLTPVEVVDFNSTTEDHAEELDQTHLSNSPERNWRKVQRRKRRFGKLSSKSKKVKSAIVASAEVKVLDLRQQMLENTVLMDLPLKRKTERWDLKPVISNCGRILAPYGSIDTAEQVKSLKTKLQHLKVDQGLAKMLSDAPTNDPVSIEKEEESRTTSEVANDGTEVTNPIDCGNNIHCVLPADSDESTKRQSEHTEGSVPLILKNNNASSQDDDNEVHSPPAVLERQIEIFCPVKHKTKGEYLLNRLKSVLSRRKRKPDILVTMEETENTSQDSEVCHKKAKVDCDIEDLMCNSGTIQTTKFGLEVSKTPSVDPIFAHALGLTPKNNPDEINKNEDQDVQQKKSLETEESPFLEKQHRIMQKPPSIFPKGGRIKTLKKHQGISAENMKKKWWLHFQTPACYASEKGKNNACIRGNSVSKTFKEKMKTACSSTDALNLLADLALSVSNDQVPPQPKPALERKPETSLKKCDLTKGLTSAEQESVLHALLRQPAARSIPPLESPSPSPFVGNTDLVGLVSKEHAYSLPPSSSLLLDLPGTPFQVLPLSGSTRLLHDHQIMYEDGIKTLHPSVIHEDINEHTRTSDYLHRHRRKFKHSRSFAMNNGSIQVTKQWKENYDFNLDSKFTSDPKDKVVIRALHGPWDFSIRDSSEEVQLIFHMWIGLFYSRSTARFFQVDSSFMHPCSEGSDSLQMANGMELGLAISELRDKTNTSVSLVSKALDLSGKDDPKMEPEPEILDLSLKNSCSEPPTSELQVNRKESSVSSGPTEHIETLEALKTPTEQQEASTFQCEKKTEDSSETLIEEKDVHESMENDPLETPVCSEHTGAPSFKNDKTFIPLQEQMQSTPLGPEADEVLDNRPVQDGFNKDVNLIRDDTDHSDSTEKGLWLKDGIDPSNCLTEKEVDFSTEENDMVISDKHYDPKSEAHKNCAMKNNLFLEDHVNPSLEVVQTEDSDDKESSIIWSRNFVENEKQLSQEECRVVSPDQTDLNRDVNCTSCEDTQLEDHHLKESRPVKKESSIFAVKVLREQQLPKMCDEPVKKDCNLEYSHQAKMDELLLPKNTKKDACVNLLADPNALKDQTPILNMPDTQSKKWLVSDDSVSNENLENIYPIDGLFTKKPALSESDETKTSVDSSQTGLCSPQTKYRAELGCENQVSDFSSDPNSINNASQETKSSEREKTYDKETENQLLAHQSHSPKSKVINDREADLFTKETNLKKDGMNGELDNSFGGVVIPFIGIDTSGVHVVQTHDDVEAVQGQDVIPFISETSSPVNVLPNDMCSKSHICGKEPEQSSVKIPLLDEIETHEQIILESVFDSRCPTPTIDERPIEYMSHSRPSNSTPAFSCSEKGGDIAEKCPSRSSMTVRNELPFEQKVQPSTVDTNNSGLHPDLELRTLRVLESISKYIAITNHMDIPSQTKTNIKKKTLEQNRSGKSIPTCLARKTPVDLMNKNTDDEKLVQAQDQHIKLSDNILSSSCTLANVLDVEMPLRNTSPSILPHHLGSADELEPSVRTNCHLSRSLSSTQGLQEEHKTSQSQIILHNEYRQCSQRPVMAVKPSKNDESQTLLTSASRDVDFETNSQSKKTDVEVKHSTPSPIRLEMKDISEENSDPINHNQDTRELFSKNSWLSNVSCSKSNSDGSRFALLDPAHQYKERNFSKFMSLSPSKQSFEFAESCPEFESGEKASLKNNLNEINDHTAEEMSWEECSDKSFMFPKDDGICKDEHALGPQCSLICTVFNGNQKGSCTLLEQLSQRCIQDDLTRASLEQESLIFEEQMKNLLKKSTRGPICQQITHDNLRLFCTSPMTVNFSSLEEQEDSLDLLDTSLVGQKIKVDMSNRKDLENENEEDKLLHPEDAGNPMEHPGICGVTAECAKLYEAKMLDICSVKKASYRQNGSRVDRFHSNTEPNNPFDFCVQMKKELDETFRTNLNAVVKKSCKTKYRFYIFVTSDDVFFEETKTHLEAEGHTAVQSSEFFIDDHSSSLLIILRNEDIEEHICKVPHLLKLKMSPGVQFAGIDEPDDVVNLTHQELFTRGGYIMFDRTILEPLSLCNMKKISEILRELSKMGKWRWMLHYRDSRRLKENARLNAEANEKKNFLYWGQDAGILEVLPYHECDLMSKAQPDYLTCLLRLQVQNISSRYTVFITDATTDSAFEKSGVLTMTLNTFLTKSSSATFTV